MIVRVPPFSSPGRVRRARSAPTAPRQPSRIRSARRRSSSAGTARVSTSPIRTGREKRAEPAALRIVSTMVTDELSARYHPAPPSTHSAPSVGRGQIDSNGTDIYSVATMARPKRGEILSLTIDDLAYGGEGVGRAD